MIDLSWGDTAARCDTLPETELPDYTRLGDTEEEHMQFLVIVDSLLNLSAVGGPEQTITPKKLEEHIAAIKKSADKFALWKSDPFIALTTYIQLVQGFGWESWRAYLHSFADASFGPAPKSDDEKRDQFLVRYSKITKKNLGDFFDFWGIPVSASARAEVAKFEKWMPKGLK